MMYTISISHKTAPVEVRRLFAFTPDEQKAFLTRALKNENITACLLLSTCNRMEVYFSGNSPINEMEQLLCSFKNVNLKEVIRYFNIYQDEQAVSHLFKVAGGIDSMVIGEDEILGQVKEAFALSLNIGATDFCLNTVFRQAITAAKKIKTCTELSKTPVSIGTLTANAVFKINKEEKTVLIIGVNGKMGTIAAKNLLSRENIKVLGTLRNHKRADCLEMQSPRLTYVSYSRRYEYMAQADVIISATASPHYTITAKEFLSAAKDGRKRLLIDLAVPNDIDPSLNKEANITLYNIDYFETLSKANNEIKQKEAETAEGILNHYVDETLKELVFHSFLPNIDSLKAYFAHNSVEKSLYTMRKVLNNNEMRTIISVFNKLISAEEK